MKERAWGPLTVTLAGGDDREGGGKGPVVCLLHGYGAPGTDLVPLFRVMPAPAKVRWAFPRAPLELGALMGMPGSDARAWWQIDPSALERAMRTGSLDEMRERVPPGLSEAREALTACLHAMREELAYDRLILGGFSQGAMLALDTTLSWDEATREALKLEGLILWSGTIINANAWERSLAQEQRRRIPVLMSHGRSDPLLPFDLSEELFGWLQKAGHPSRFVDFRGGHEIPPSVLEATQAFLSDRWESSTGDS